MTNSLRRGPSLGVALLFVLAPDVAQAHRVGDLSVASLDDQPGAVPPPDAPASSEEASGAGGMASSDPGLGSASSTAGGGDDASAQLAREMAAMRAEMAEMRAELDSVFNMSHQVFPGMRERGFGRIINISSINGQKGQMGQVNYSAAKAGMIGFTRALERASHQASGVPIAIRINVVSAASWRVIPRAVRSDSASIAGRPNQGSE